MRTIEYKVTYTGAREIVRGKFRHNGDGAEVEYVKVQARDINAGYAKALKRANEPLGNGVRREIGALEFWQVL
jgi:hypothetical protein